MTVQPTRTAALLVAGVLTLAAAGASASTAGAAPSSCGSRTNNSLAKLLECVDLAGVRAHQAALQSIADANNGTRVSGSPGYDQSVAYVKERLGAAGWKVTQQDFQFQTFVSLAPSILEQVAPPPAGPVANTILSYSGSGDVTAAVTALPGPATDPTPGCEAADFAGFVPGNIALVSRGACTFAIKATNAYAAGAVGVVIYNNTAGDINGTLGQHLHPRPPRGVRDPGDRAAARGHGRARHAGEDRDPARHRHDVERAGRAAGQERRQRRDGRGAPGLGERRPGHQRQRQRVSRAHRGRGEPAWGQAAEHPAVRVVGSRGVEPRGLDVLREHAPPGRARPDRALPQLRHDRLAEPRLLHLRR